jgi:hypothetical protein
VPYSSQQINDYIQSTGIANNPWAIYNAARNYGVTGAQIDQARGWAPGTSDAWVAQQGLQPLSGGYGYGQSPSQAWNGYYEQQTPAGSFAAAVQQQAVNPWIGQTTPGVVPQRSVMPWAQQLGQVATQANPYLGQSSARAQQVGSNPYSGSNPYIQQAIDAASQDAIRNYNTAIRPQLDSMARASGSFGNTAIQELQQNAMGDLGRHLGNIASGMRMQDYTQQQQLAENALARQQQTNLFNAQQSAADLSRNLSGWLSGQQLGLQGLGQQLGAAQFDATLGNNIGQFNASLMSNELGRNANLAQSLAQFNAGQGNGLNQFNAGQANQMLGQVRALNEQGRQFDQNMDLNAFNANMNWANQAQQNQINTLGALLNWNQQYGVGNANQTQNTPLNYWLQFTNGANQIAGQGGSASTPYFGNPLMGAIGGAQLAGTLWNGWRR